MENQTRTEREKYIDKISAKLKEWDGDLEKLEARAEKLVDDMKLKYRERIEKLRSRRIQMKETLKRLEDSGEEAFQPIKSDLEKLWEDSKNGLKKIRDDLK